MKYLITVQCPPDEIEDFTESWQIQELGKLQEYWCLLYELASARCWSQSLYTTCLPNSFAALLHDDRGLAQQHLDLIHRTLEAVQKAESLVFGDLDPSCSKKVKEAVHKLLVNDLAWNRLQVTRELWARCEGCHWQVSDSELQEFLRALFGHCPNTKFDLEDAFAHLASVGRMSSMATAMSKSHS